MSVSDTPDLWQLYRQMLRSRLFEQAVGSLWEAGRISGEMHTSCGEEAIIAGILDHLQEGDAMALDHRGTAPLVMRGVDLQELLLEFLGHPRGLCRGRGGHMHLFSRPHLAASTGIVGATGPTALGFALAAQHLRPGTLALSFFGDGALNQGMLMESFNLAVTWNLPILFVCKDNSRAITTISSTVTAGDINERVRSFRVKILEVNGTDVELVWRSAQQLCAGIRTGKGPGFLHATCYQLDGHFLGDPLLRVTRNPLGEIGKMAGSLFKSVMSRKGGSFKERSESLLELSTLVRNTVKFRRAKEKDPLEIVRKKLRPQKSRLQQLEQEVREEIDGVVERALRIVGET